MPVNDKNVRLLGILGMPGSGKTLLSTLLGQAGLPVISLGRFVIDEVLRQGMEPSPQSEQEMRSALRKKNGPQVLAELAMAQVSTDVLDGLVVLDGVYSPHEDDFFRNYMESKYFTIAVLCDKSLRYARVANREHRPLTAVEAESRDRHELEILRKAEPIVLSDYFVTNNAGERVFLRTAVERIATHVFNVAANQDHHLAVRILRAGPKELLRIVSEEDWVGSDVQWVVLAALLIEDNAVLTWNACHVIGERRAQGVLDFLLWVASGSDLVLEDSSLHLIAAYGAGRTVQTDKLAELLNSDDFAIRRFAVDSLGESRNASSIDRLLDVILNEQSIEVVEWAGLSLSKVTPPGSPRSSHVEAKLLDAMNGSGEPWRTLIAFDSLARINLGVARVWMQDQADPVDGAYGQRLVQIKESIGNG